VLGRRRNGITQLAPAPQPTGRPRRAIPSAIFNADADLHFGSHKPGFSTGPPKSLPVGTCGTHFLDATAGVLAISKSLGSALRLDTSAFVLEVAQIAPG